MTPTHITQTGVLDLVFQAGFVAKMILLLLLFASILCWAIIFSKWKRLNLAHRQNDKFMHTFWSGKSLDEIVNKTENYPNSPLAAVFNYAVKEMKKLPP